MTVNQLYKRLGQYIKKHPDRTNYILWDPFYKTFDVDLAFVRKGYEYEDAFYTNDGVRKGMIVNDNHVTAY